MTEDGGSDMENSRADEMDAGDESRTSLQPREVRRRNLGDDRVTPRTCRYSVSPDHSNPCGVFDRGIILSEPSHAHPRVGKPMQPG